MSTDSINTIIIIDFQTTALTSHRLAFARASGGADRGSWFLDRLSVVIDKQLFEERRNPFSSGQWLCLLHWHHKKRDGIPIAPQQTKAWGKDTRRINYLESDGATVDPLGFSNQPGGYAIDNRSPPNVRTIGRREPRHDKRITLECMKSNTLISPSGQIVLYERKFHWNSVQWGRGGDLFSLDQTKPSRQRTTMVVLWWRWIIRRFHLAATTVDLTSGWTLRL